MLGHERQQLLDALRHAVVVAAVAGGGWVGSEDGGDRERDRGEQLAHAKGTETNRDAALEAVEATKGEGKGSPMVVFPGERCGDRTAALRGRAGDGTLSLTARVMEGCAVPTRLVVSWKRPGASSAFGNFGGNFGDLFLADSSDSSALAQNNLCMPDPPQTNPQFMYIIMYFIMYFGKLPLASQHRHLSLNTTRLPCHGHFSPA